MRSFFFLNAVIYRHRFLSKFSAALAISRKFWYVVSSVSFISKDFTVSFLISSWTNWLLESVLFRLYHGCEVSQPLPVCDF